MTNDTQGLESRIETLESELATLKRRQRRPGRSVRKRSQRTLMGLPLYDIALGPDPSRNESIGQARGFFAIGNIATGVFALGGIAIGVFSLGGVSFGLLLALGGLSIGSLAAGGAAVGIIAAGGAAVGYMAYGGAAVGCYAYGAAVKVLNFTGR